MLLKSETLKVRGSKDSNTVAKPKSLTLGRGKSPPVVDRLGVNGKDRITNPQSQFLTPNCSCLKVQQREKWRGDRTLFNDQPNLGSISWGWRQEWGAPRPDTDAMLCL